MSPDIQLRFRCYNTCVAIAGAILLIAVSNCLPARGETIELTNGTSLTGTLLKSDGTVFTFIVDNKTVTKKREEIAAIVFVQRKNPPEAAKESEMKAAATAAIEALEALDSVTKSGVTRIEYAKRKADAQIALDKFINQWGKDNIVAQWLSIAMVGYDLADTTWGLPSEHGFIVQSGYINSLLKIFPQLKDKLIDLPGYAQSLYVGDALSAIWGKSAEAIKATRLKLSELK